MKVIEKEEIKKYVKTPKPRKRNGLTGRQEKDRAEKRSSKREWFFLFVLAAIIAADAYLFSGHIAGLGTLAIVFVELIFIIFLADKLDIDKVETLLYSILESFNNKP